MWRDIFVENRQIFVLQIVCNTFFEGDPVEICQYVDVSDDAAVDSGQYFKEIL